MDTVTETSTNLADMYMKIKFIARGLTQLDTRDHRQAKPPIR